MRTYRYKWSCEWVRPLRLNVLLVDWRWTSDSSRPPPWKISPDWWVNIGIRNDLSSRLEQRIHIQQLPHFYQLEGTIRLDTRKFKTWPTKRRTSVTAKRKFLLTKLCKWIECHRIASLYSIARRILDRMANICKVGLAIICLYECLF